MLTALLAFAASHADARTIRVDDEYGCGLFRSQLERLEVMRTSMETSMLRAQGDKSETTKLASEKAAKDMVEISKTRCRPISGRYEVVERRAVPGGEAVRLQVTKYESLWVLGPFK